MNKTKQWVLIAFLASILVLSKELFSALPNIELVSFLLIVYTKTLPVSMVYSISIVFCFLQILLYGIGLWTPVYFIVWPLFVKVTYHIQNKLKNETIIAIYNALFGLCFGFFNSIPYFILDFTFGWAGFLRGIPYDLIHAIGNYIIALVLYQPIFKQLQTLINKYKV